MIESSAPPFSSWFADENLKTLWLMFFLNTLFATSQLIGAAVANSLAMVGDSASMYVDSVTYLVNIYAERSKTIDELSVRTKKTYEAIAASISTMLLLIVTAWLMNDARGRLAALDRGESSEPDVNGKVVLGFALANLAIDVAMCGSFWFKRNAPDELDDDEADVVRKHMPSQMRDLNMCSAFGHLLSDTLRTITVLIAGGMESADAGVSGVRIDAVASLIVGSLIIIAAVVVFYEAFREVKSVYNKASGRVGDIELR